MKKRYLYNITVVILCMSLLTGCANTQGTPVTGEGKEEEIVSLGLAPEFNYEIPQSIPDIMVDQLGYAADGKKIAVFRGEILPDTYDLVDAATEEVVYTGTIVQKGYNEATQENISTGDFTDYAVTGTYYLQAEMMGQSYPFVIVDKPYAGIFDAALKQYFYSRCGLTLSTELAGESAHNACHTKTAGLMEDAAAQIDVLGGWHIDENGKRDVVQGCRAVSNLLLAYELYGEVFSDEVGIPESGNNIPDVMDEVKYEVDWLLKMQDSASGAVYSSITVIDNAASTYQLYIDSVTMDATIHFAATMAKFSYLYQNYDLSFATQCLKAADRAYRYAGKYMDSVEPEDYFYASVELYRATGTFGYRKAAQDYLNSVEEPDMNDDSVFWGCATYLSTKQKVDIGLCNKVIAILLRDVEEISYASKNSKYLAQGNKAQNNNSELLGNTARLALVNHIITNHEYTVVLENYLHYFLGRNAQSICYIDGVGSRNYKMIDEKTGIMKQVDLNAELILLMSAIEAEMN